MEERAEPENQYPSGDSARVFISYASQDAALVQKVCGGLEAAGFYCWIAPRDVVPGMLYAEGIVRAINDSKVLVLILSESAVASAHVGKEIERASSKRHPIIALRTDKATLPPAFEYFLNESQWIDIEEGGTDAAIAKLVSAVRRHLSPGATSAPTPANDANSSKRAAATPRRPWYIAASVMILALIAAFLLADKLRLHGLRGSTDRAASGSRQSIVVEDTGAKESHSASATSAEVFAPPAHSVAVLSCVNMSGEAKDEYFSDGLSEELLNSLARINELQVTARTSSFSFKNQAIDIPTVGRKLNVASVLEGSVRKAGKRVRITAQLISATSGFHLWSQTYDRDLTDIFALQTEIATAVAGALKVTLLGETRQRLKGGGTLNPQAFDAYLRGRGKKYMQNEEENRAALVAFEEAIALDPAFAEAYATRALALVWLANVWTPAEKERERIGIEARRSAEKAVSLAPTSGQAYGALALVLWSSTLDTAAIDAAFQRGLTLEPGNSDILLAYSRSAPGLGRADALSAADRAVTLNPLDSTAHVTRGLVLYFLRRHREARASLLEALRLGDNVISRYWAAANEVSVGNPAAAVRYSERDRESFYGQHILAIAYYQMGRKKDAYAVLNRMTTDNGDSAAYAYAQILAQWGQPERALEWLATAFRRPDTGSLDVIVDPMLDPIRGTPQFQEIVRRLQLTNAGGQTQ
jgi:TolB-like protein/tetratricopeptide (TPR) repeat protein